MNKWNKILCASAMIVASCFLLNGQSYTSAQEDDKYPMACDLFEVSDLQSDGTFQKVSCASSFDEAKAAMRVLGDGGVVRHADSKSPTKVIAANSGVVYSYPQRSNKNIAVLQQYSDGSSQNGNKSTYVTVHRPMGYYGTTTYSTYSGNGLVRIMLNGFDGYINLNECDIVPMKAISEGIGLYLGGGGTADAYAEDPFLIKCAQPYFTVEQSGNYRDLVYHWSLGYAKPDDPTHKSREFTHHVGPAASWMALGSKFYSNDGFNFYTDRNCTQLAGMYYNYYQFLPLRTKTKIPASVFNKFLATKGMNSTSKMWDTGDIFLKAQEDYGVNAMLMFAMGCLESAYGTSNFAVNRNNLFGVAAYDSNPNAATYFRDITHAVENQAGALLRGYLNTSNYVCFGQHLGNKGSGINVKYAGDPFWGIKIASIAYDLDKCSRNYNGTLTDFNSVALGLVPDYIRANVTKTPGGATLYNSSYGGKYQKNHIMAILGESGNYYKVQSTNYIDANGNAMTNFKNVGLLPYSWNRNVGWISKESISRVNDAPIGEATEDTSSELPDEIASDAAPKNPDSNPTGKFVATTDSIKFQNNGTLLLSGKSYRENRAVDKNKPAKVNVDIVDMTFEAKKRIQLTPKVTNGSVLSWDCKVDLSNLKRGSYMICVSVDYGSNGNANDYKYLTMDNQGNISTKVNGAPVDVVPSEGSNPGKIMIKKKA